MMKSISLALLLAISPMAVYAQDAQPTPADADQPEPASDLESLLKRVQEGRKTESALHKEREAQFLARRDQQQALLRAEEQTRRNLERRSEQLEQTRRENNERINQLDQQKRERLGQLEELFGVLQQASSDAKAVISSSHITVDNPTRMASIDNLVDKAKDSASLPTIADIRAWPTEMMREMVGSSQIVKFPSEVTRTNGNRDEIELIRIGDFGLAGDGGYFSLKPGPRVEDLARQPSARFTSTVSDLQAASSGFVNVALDPTRGQLLTLEVQKPTLEERVAQGGEVGYIILALGAVGVLMAVIQWVYLLLVGAKVRGQIRNRQPNNGNPLGRILAVYDENRSVDVETLELKMDEAILKETPALERFLTLIKLISAVAPLFGLLGTVIGMIETFQAITLFGTGDPKLMAGGISTALMTTVLGLVVAIPTLLLHAFVAGASKSVIHVLEEQSAGIIAVHAEEEKSGASAN